MHKVIVGMIVVTLGTCFVAAHFEMRVQKQMEAALDWQKMPLSWFETITRNVPQEYKRMDPGNILNKTYKRYLKLRVWLLGIFVVELLSLWLIG